LLWAYRNARCQLLKEKKFQRLKLDFVLPTPIIEFLLFRQSGRGTFHSIIYIYPYINNHITKDPAFFEPIDTSHPRTGSHLINNLIGSTLI
jgi:hypothetical protein